jgi:hypothetical protein
MKTCVLQKARSWDDGVADKFKNTTYDEIFEGKKVRSRRQQPAPLHPHAPALKLKRHLSVQVIVFAVPGAFTGVCHNAHVPSYSKNVAAFKAKGVDSVICVSVNDPYTMNAWKKTLGASGEGIEFYGDSNGSFTHYMVSSPSPSTSSLSLPHLHLSLSPLHPHLISLTVHAVVALTRIGSHAAPRV